MLAIARPVSPGPFGDPGSALYRAAKADGASSAELRKWFQYPSGQTHPLGIVRHFPHHADHMHVRFVCPASDPECVTFRPLLGIATASR